jgi:hypothetical protein
MPWNGFIEDVPSFYEQRWELYLDYKLWHNSQFNGVELIKKHLRTLFEADFNSNERLLE